MFDSMAFEWDEVKAASNLEKHGIDFPLARRVFLDTDRLEFESHGEYDERRWTVTGLIDNRLLVLIYTIRGERYRLISARRADRNERRRYWNRDDETGFE
ncbi:MAG TPA: BrnT family toxin [Acidobacteriaceae bacterium]|nr:BrnT family toxin [Acidobacteriaceae bacterium]